MDDDRNPWDPTIVGGMIGGISVAVLAFALLVSLGLVFARGESVSGEWYLISALMSLVGAIPGVVVGAVIGAAVGYCTRR